jgi:hypothetical protein
MESSTYSAAMDLRPKHGTKCKPVTMIKFATVVEWTTAMCWMRVVVPWRGWTWRVGPCRAKLLGSKTASAPEPLLTRNKKVADKLPTRSGCSWSITISMLRAYRIHLYRFSRRIGEAHVLSPREMITSLLSFVLAEPHHEAHLYRRKLTMTQGGMEILIVIGIAL